MIARVTVRLFCSALLTLGSGELDLAADDQAVRQLERVREEIAQLSADRERFAHEEEGLLGKLQRIEAETRWLDAKREEAQLLSDQAQRELDVAERDLHRSELALAHAREQFRSLLALLHRAGPLGPVRALLTAQTASDLAQGARIAHELSRRQRSEVLALREANQVTQQQRDERAKRAAEFQTSLVQTRQAVLALQSASAERRRLVEQVHRERTVREQALMELHRAGEQLQTLLGDQRDAQSVALDITRFRGLLTPPAGKLVRGFGDRVDARFGTRLPHPGWDVELPFGARVDAVFDGRVVFADWFRGYGLTVVLDHGHGIHSVYAHLSAITAPSGSTLSKGEPLGRVGDTGSLEGVGLYFELRQKGKAIDPADWFTHGSNAER